MIEDVLLDGNSGINFNRIVEIEVGASKW